MIDRAPDVLPPRLALGRALALRHRRQLAPRHVAHHPLLVLREVVEAENARVAAAVLDRLLDDLAGSALIGRDLSAARLIGIAR